METRLKERLTGAIVLVLAAVVFIPVLLDGPGRNRQVSQAVPLPAAGSDRRTVRIDLDAPVSASRSAVQTATEAPASVDLVPQQEQEPAAGPTRASNANESASAAATNPVDAQPRTAARTTEPVTDPWTVQVGAFGRAANANALVERLRSLGYSAHVSEFRDTQSTHYRVRVGGFPTRESAQAKADEIRDKTGEPARPTSTD